MWKYIEKGSITSVEGIKATGIHCGLKAKRKDLALILSDNPCIPAGTFTQNKVKAAPIVISKKMIQNDQTIKAILVNSGNANACTGEQGYNDALEIRDYCAKKLNLKNEEVLISSTGVIGQRIKKDVVLNGIDKIIPFVNSDGGVEASEAIMTTDLKKKHLALEVNLSFGKCVIGGVSKGSGMIMPNMATMLAFLATDIKIKKQLLQKILIESVDNSFNKISVDGETSTNDMVVLLSNDNSSNELIAGTEDEKIFIQALTNICQKMAKSIVADGEGATKLITINVLNAKSEKDADLIGKTLANSPLVKTAVHGNDANWGRIISAVGYSGAEFNPENLLIKFDDIPILCQNYQADFDEETATNLLSKEKVTISVDLNEGNQKSTWWTCDFSENYIKINSSYRS